MLKKKEESRNEQLITCSCFETIKRFSNNVRKLLIVNCSKNATNLKHLICNNIKHSK